MPNSDMSDNDTSSGYGSTNAATTCRERDRSAYVMARHYDIDRYSESQHDIPHSNLKTAAFLWDKLAPNVGHMNRAVVTSDYHKLLDWLATVVRKNQDGSSMVTIGNDLRGQADEAGDRTRITIINQLESTGATPCKG